MGLCGEVLHGQFRVDDLVEDGKRSALYRGHHLMLEVPIAIKCMKSPPGAAPETFIRRFRHESRLHYKLAQGNPHIVRVLASGTAVAPASGGLCPFMVLEWLNGLSLADDFRERRGKGMKGRSLAEAIRLLDPAIDALAFAHACGIVHREVTPENLFLASTPEGQRIKVLDFGVAKILSEKALDLAPASQSIGLGPVGSPAYAAPEQFNESIGPVGPWTDVYTIVLVLLEALRDRVVMEDGPSPLPLRVMDRARRPTPRALGLDLGDAVEEVIAQGVAVEPRDRPQDIGLFWGMLKNAAQKDVTRSSTAPVPTVVQSPFADSVAAITEPSSQALPRYADADAPASSNVEDRTVIMQVEDIQKMNKVDVDAEPLTPGAELFVADDQPTQMYREETLAAAGISRSGRWNVEEQLSTMVSAGAAPKMPQPNPSTSSQSGGTGPMPIPPTSPMTVKPLATISPHQPPPAYVAPPAPAHVAPPPAQVAGPPGYYPPQRPHHPFVVDPTPAMAPGNPTAPTIPPQGIRPHGVDHAPSKSGVSLSLVLVAVFVLVGLLAAAGVYAMGVL
jgi:serine/threonine-protein kinase